MFTGPGAGNACVAALHAVVVPDAAVLRERKIVNVKELIRFELEGLSLALPADGRVVDFDVTMEPLPRNRSGALDRHEIAERYRTGRLRIPRTGAASVPPDDHTQRVVAFVQAAVRPGIIVRPDSNLELDLGLDSIDRVELLASLEQRFGVRVPDDVAHCAFLVGDIAEAFRGATETGARPVAWESLLDAGDKSAEPQALLERRAVTALVVFGLLRGLVRALAPPRVTGLEHLPRTGPFIITPNHQSYIDPLVLMSVLPFGVLRQLFFVGAAEYFETPVTAWLARRLNLVAVDPDANLLPAMQAAAFGLKHGKVLVLFPEGERSIDGTVKKFKKGAAILSRHLNAPVVPVAINGVFEIWPRNRPVDWRRLLPWSRHRPSVRFGTPIPSSAAGSYADHIDAVRAAVEQLWLASCSSEARSA